MARCLDDAPWGFTSMGVVFGPLAAVASVASGIASIGGTIAGMAGTAQSAKTARLAGAVAQAGAQAEGDNAVAAADYKATQLRQQAQEARASQQRAAFETRRKGDLAQSTLRARAAAGGGGATDNTVLNLTGQIAGRTEFESLVDMYKGENAARGLEDAANAAIYGGKVAKQAAGFKAAGYGYQTAGTIAQSQGSMASQFGSLVNGLGGLGSSITNINWGGGTSFMPTTGNTGWASPLQRA